MGVPAAVQADHDDDYGRAFGRPAHSAGARRRLRVVAPTGDRNRRRLLFSQMLTLYTTAVVYLYMSELRMWLVSLRRKSVNVTIEPWRA